MRRRPSPKRAALELHYKKSWQEVAREWAERPFSLDYIGNQWQQATGEQYSRQMVSRILIEARDGKKEGAAP